MMMYALKPCMLLAVSYFRSLSLMHFIEILANLISGIVRENMDGCQKFLDLEGLEIMLRTIKRNNDKLRTKSAFFLDALCGMRREIVGKKTILAI